MVSCLLVSWLAPCFLLYGWSITIVFVDVSPTRNDFLLFDLQKLFWFQKSMDSHLVTFAIRVCDSHHRQDGCALIQELHFFKASGKMQGLMFEDDADVSD